uniref:Glutathione S-transferase 10 n=1 Tax=Subpsaltria yangi TaxID=1195109 RepID=A0A2L1DG94_9HEMI|nr:glutathione S-transferase 10 [Subpsaltria yangi]
MLVGFCISLVVVKMTIDFYYTPSSPPCRAVMMAARALDLELNFKIVDLTKKEHLRPSYLRICPMHTVPTIVDNTDQNCVVTINESRAIMCYFADKYGLDKHEYLYPLNLERRAVVNQRLYFDLGTLYQRFSDLYYPVILWGEKSLNPDKKKKLEEAFGFFDKYLEGSPPWAAGRTITVADFSMAATVSTAVACGFDLNIDNYFYVHKWFDLVTTAIKDYDKINKPGTESFQEKARKAKLIS